MKRGLAGMGSALAGRAQLMRGTAPAEAHVPPLRLFLAELGAVAEPLRIRFRPDLPIRPAQRPRVVILIPGFATGPTRMRYMAEQLERAGHTVKRWGLGHNMGPTPETLDLIAARVEQVRERYGQQVVLVGWSLGGVFAREVAKRVPQHVAKVVTMGSPFSHTPYSNNIWRTYQVVAGHRVEAPPVAADPRTKPPVETVAFWSPRDGVISRRAASGTADERDRAVALRCTHLTFPTSPDCIMALVRELES
ncbi:hypothetical protein AAW00_00380 [Aurantiacibacter luteus]|uniref:AB hydrolase-1 domain-containing protein n=2 Tax=Aurantiacibacter luteus TaxID=1581420 RepID=A0A0G9MZ17_9SPHN|nr:hypothetical protein AAW00_00380 [Aurantiacibacter luteus]